MQDYNSFNTLQPHDQMMSQQNQSPAQHLPCKLFIGGLSYDTTDASLASHFSQFGEVISSIVLRDPVTTHSRGFGFVTFSSKQGADKVLQQSRNHVVDGRKVEAKIAVPRSATNPVTKKVPKQFGAYNPTNPLPHFHNPNFAPPHAPQSFLSGGLNYTNSIPPPYGYDMNSGRSFPPVSPEPNFGMPYQGNYGMGRAPQPGPGHFENSKFQFGERNSPVGSPPGLVEPVGKPTVARVASAQELNLDKSKDGSSKLLVSELPPNSTEKDLKELLSKFGKINSAQLDETKKSALVVFENENWNEEIRERSMSFKGSTVSVKYIPSDAALSEEEMQKKFKLFRSNTLPVNYNIEAPLFDVTQKNVGPNEGESRWREPGSPTQRNRFYTSYVNREEPLFEDHNLADPFFGTSVNGKEAFNMNRSKSINANFRGGLGVNLHDRSDLGDDLLGSMKSLSLRDSNRMEKASRRLTFHPSARGFKNSFESLSSGLSGASPLSPGGGGRRSSLYSGESGAMTGNVRNIKLDN
eukprot:snap_masked-scaffold_51-processed-gene-1.20-mRNA-1 protein AED:0.35 eAED:0.36 QI:0/-1/0/1/-1/1/1/0/522